MHLFCSYDLSLFTLEGCALFKDPSRCDSLLVPLDVKLKRLACARDHRIEGYDYGMMLFCVIVHCYKVLENLEYRVQPRLVCLEALVNLISLEMRHGKAFCAFVSSSQLRR